jgi:caa(3)-type oxidase subunit IV
MSESHEHAHHGPDVALYFKVFGALAICTALSFVVNLGYPPPNTTGASIIMGIAVLKAALVGYIFMHLKWDWKNLYFLIVPLFILGAMMMFVLMPDILYAWRSAPG